MTVVDPAECRAATWHRAVLVQYTRWVGARPPRRCSSGGCFAVAAYVLFSRADSTWRGLRKSRAFCLECTAHLPPELRPEEDVP